MIHRYWAGPTGSYDWSGEVLAHTHPGHDVTLWSAANLPDELATLLEPLGIDQRRARANVARIWLLHHFGGLWVDHDIIPLARLDTSPTPWTAGLHTNRGMIRESCALWFPEAGHPMLAIALAELVADPTRLLADVLNAIPAESTADVGLEPRVNPYDANGRPVLDQRIRPLAVHLWANSRRSK